jgi:hypothetical protein
MLTWNRTLGLECQQADAYPTYRAYVEAQTDLFVESMQDAADNEWHSIRWRMEGASEEEVGAEMERWWKRQVRRFQSRLRQEFEEERQNRLKKRLRRESRRRLQAKEALQATQIELQQAKDDLAIERGLTGQLRDQLRCRDCNGKLWN